MASDLWLSSDKICQKYGQHSLNFLLYAKYYTAWILWNTIELYILWKYNVAIKCGWSIKNGYLQVHLLQNDPYVKEDHWNRGTRGAQGTNTLTTTPKGRECQPRRALSEYSGQHTQLIGSVARVTGGELPVIVSWFLHSMGCINYMKTSGEWGGSSLMQHLPDDTCKKWNCRERNAGWTSPEEQKFKIDWLILCNTDCWPGLKILTLVAGLGQKKKEKMIIGSD